MSSEAWAPHVRLRRLRDFLVRLTFALVLVTWFLFLRPQALGGPAAYIMVAGTSMEPTISRGTLVVATPAASYALGDVIAYRIPQGELGAGINVIHRIVGGSTEVGFVMRGDNTSSPDPWRPKPGDIIGKLWLAIPGVTPLLLFLRSPLLVASVAAGIAVYIVLGWWPERRKGSAGDDADLSHRPTTLIG